MSRSFHPPRMQVAEDSLPVRLGEVLAEKYRVDQLLGVGGMAVVLAGTHVELDAPIAIKLLLPTRAASPDAVKRFLTEARAAAKLQSENVARISDVGTARTASGHVLPFIVMERLDGVDLATLMETRKRLPVDEALDFARQACRGLAEAHAAKIVHRDVKPANLFFTRGRDGAPLVKVLDFGISKTLASIETKVERVITADKELMGSPGYMSPEQVRREESIDERTDIWSIGVVLHELMSGRDAFAGDTLDEIFASILHAEPAPLDGDVPAEVQAIVRRCLEKDPARRYQTMRQLIDALTSALDRPAGVPARDARRPLVLAGFAGLAVIGSLFALLARTRDAEPTSTPSVALSLESAIAVPAAAAAPAPEPTTASVTSAVPPEPAAPVAREPASAAARAPSSPPSPPATPAPSATPSPPTLAPPAASKPPGARRRTDW